MGVQKENERSWKVITDVQPSECAKAKSIKKRIRYERVENPISLYPELRQSELPEKMSEISDDARERVTAKPNMYSSKEMSCHYIAYRDGDGLHMKLERKDNEHKHNPHES